MVGGLKLLLCTAAAVPVQKMDFVDLLLENGTDSRAAIVSGLFRRCIAA